MMISGVVGDWGRGRDTDAPYRGITLEPSLS
jgi:hypothetical protein